VPNRFHLSALQGKTLLVTGGAGAVGHYAVQLASWAGATVIATVSSSEKADRARAGGAAHVINYRSEDVAARVLDITGGVGVDHIAEVDFGGNLAATLRCLRVNGSIMIYASNGDRELAAHTLPLVDPAGRRNHTRAIAAAGAGVCVSAACAERSKITVRDRQSNAGIMRQFLRMGTH
jgi:NADPH:quinone reductase-like Zn-dependent oxidoreductase